jgi:AcrR family transcriptional regulator
MRDATGTRTRIEREAMCLFVEKGVAETSVRDVAKAAGVAEGAMYRHFASKEELVASLFLTHYLEFARVLERLQVEASGTQAKLDAMIFEFCRFFDVDQVLFRFLLFVQHGQLTKVPPAAKTPVDVIRDVIAAGMRGGEVPKGDAELATAMVMGLVLQVATAIVYGRITGALSPHAARLGAAASAVLASGGARRRAASAA